MFQAVEKIKTYIFCSVAFSRKSCRLWDNVEKYGGARGATNDVTTWLIRVACCVSRCRCTQRVWTSTRTHVLAHAHTDTYLILTAFHCNNDFANASACYVIRRLPVLFSSKMKFYTMGRLHYLPSTASRCRLLQAAVVTDVVKKPSVFYI